MDHISKTLSFQDIQLFCFPIYRYMSSLALRSEASSASSPRFARFRSQKVLQTIYKQFFSVSKSHSWVKLKIQILQRVEIPLIYFKSIKKNFILSLEAKLSNHDQRAQPSKSICDMICPQVGHFMEEQRSIRRNRKVLNLPRYFG